MNKATPCSACTVKPLKLGVKDTNAKVVAPIIPAPGENKFLAAK